jgi:hypothetical protein
MNITNPKVSIFGTAPASAEEAVRLADELMYRVKNSGKNKVFFENFDQVEKSDQEMREKRARKPRDAATEKPQA